MEQNVLRMLDSMISTTADPEIVEVLKHHKEETKHHEHPLWNALKHRGLAPRQ